MDAMYNKHDEQYSTCIYNCSNNLYKHAYRRQKSWCWLTISVQLNTALELIYTISKQIYYARGGLKMSKPHLKRDSVVAVVSDLWAISQSWATGTNYKSTDYKLGNFWKSFLVENYRKFSTCFHLLFKIYKFRNIYNILI